jgi:hypothetical protein
MLKQYQSINKPETKKPIHKTKLFTYSKRQETSIKTVATPKTVADNQIDPKTATISEQGQGINFMLTDRRLNIRITLRLRLAKVTRLWLYL